jgi:hypothetical protein
MRGLRICLCENTKYIFWNTHDISIRTFYSLFGTKINMCRYEYTKCCIRNKTRDVASCRLGASESEGKKIDNWENVLSSARNSGKTTHAIVQSHVVRLIYHKSIFDLMISVLELYEHIYRNWCFK